MVRHDEPFSVSIPEYHGEPCRTLYLLAILNVRERVVTRVDRHVTINPKVLFAEGNSCVRPLSGVFEILGDCTRIWSNRLRGRAPKYGVGVVHCRDAHRVTTIVCSAPGCSRGCHLILSAGAATAGTCRAGRQQCN